MTTAIAPITVHRVQSWEYALALGVARHDSERIAAMTSDPNEMPGDAAYYMTDDFESGFGITPDGTLIGLYSQIKGRGEALMWDAVTHKGAKRLDCFDGFLPDYYKQFGFVETERVPNWTPGEPDVVFMAL